MWPHSVTDPHPSIRGIRNCILAAAMLCNTLHDNGRRANYSERGEGVTAVLTTRAHHVVRSTLCARSFIYSIYYRTFQLLAFPQRDPLIFPVKRLLYTQQNTLAHTGTEIVKKKMS